MGKNPVALIFPGYYKIKRNFFSLCSLSLTTMMSSPSRGWYLSKRNCFSTDPPTEGQETS